MTSNTYTANFSKIELEWLQRHLMHNKDKVEGAMKTYTQPAGKLLTDLQNKELVEMIKYKDELASFIHKLGDCIGHHEKMQSKMRLLREELQEALELAEEPEAREAAKAELLGLPEQPPISITFDRTTLRFTLKLIEEDLHKFRTSIIPNAEASLHSDYPDKIKTKSYYVNRARKHKNILEKMKTKLEKGL